MNIPKDKYTEVPTPKKITKKIGYLRNQGWTGGIEVDEKTGDKTVWDGMHWIKTYREKESK